MAKWHKPRLKGRFCWREGGGDSWTFGAQIDCLSFFMTEYSISVLLWETIFSPTLFLCFW